MEVLNACCAYCWHADGIDGKHAKCAQNKPYVKMHTKFCDETPKTGVHFRNVVVNGRIILN